MARLKVERRREQLTETAVAIALRDGLDNMTIRRVADEAGVALGTVHYCFPSKAALLTSVVEYLFSEEQLGEPASFDPNLEPLEGVRQMLRTYWLNSGADRSFQRLVYELVTYLIRQGEQEQALAAAIFEKNHAFVDAFIASFEQTYSRRVTVSRQLLARMIIAMTDGTALAWLVNQDEAAAFEILDEFAELLLTKSEPV